jgi:hypothetical protein
MPRARSRAAPVRTDRSRPTGVDLDRESGGTPYPGGEISEEAGGVSTTPKKDHDLVDRLASAVREPIGVLLLAQVAADDRWLAQVLDVEDRSVRERRLDLEPTIASQ